MTSAQERAQQFLNQEKAFRLGALLTEASHPKTQQLSQTAQQDLPAAIRMLQSVDAEIPPAAHNVFQQESFKHLVKAFLTALESGRKIYFTGCGATGRLSILLEAAWRNFWQGFKQTTPKQDTKNFDREDCVFSVMAGGDYALIKSVEGFEDFTNFGRYQIQQAGVNRDDVVVAVTEGGETSFVIGTAWQGLESGAQVFFVYNNPTDLLCKHVQRSREIIKEPRIVKIDLTTGPMAITGSTRMQATTIELLVIAAALETALLQFLQNRLSFARWEQLKFCLRPAQEYHQLFQQLLDELTTDTSIKTLARLTQFEETIYRNSGLVTYLTDAFLLDVLTDTTERSPTFMLPPFRKNDDNISPRPWAFVKDPFRPTPVAWSNLLRRPPRGLTWKQDVYKKLGAPGALQQQPPQLDNEEIYKFQIGSEPDPTRTDTPDSALVIISVGEDTSKLIQVGREKFLTGFNKTALVTIGPDTTLSFDGELFSFPCDLPASPLRLWHHLAVKLILNTISTATMVLMDRVIGNTMVWLSPSNKKLIDRGTRLIALHAGCSYEQACIMLHKTLEEVQQHAQTGEDVPSPVAQALKRLGYQHPK